MTINVLRAGNGARPKPFTIVFIANPALERFRQSGKFVADPILSAKSAFDACVAHAVNCLFGLLTGQQERLLSHAGIASEVRVLSLFDATAGASDATSLVAEDDPGTSSQLIARRHRFNEFLATHGLYADVAFAISSSPTHQHATAWPASDDVAQGGVQFTFDSGIHMHCFFTSVPGTVALHVDERDLTPLHEFQHAMGSFQNLQVDDLYMARGSGSAVNKKFMRPIPADFCVYNGATYASDLERFGVGYPSGWTSYHCARHSHVDPAVMDNYYLAPSGNSLNCENDMVTRQFIVDRIISKAGR